MHIFKNLKFLIKQIVGQNFLVLKVFINLLNIKKKYNLVNNSTDIVIEGFPRSGNTFATACFASANSNSNIARHHHCISQLKEGLKRKIPTIALIRSPRDSIISFLIRRPEIKASFVINEYLVFYNYVKSYYDSLLIIEFDKLIKSHTFILEILEERYPQKFNTNNHHSYEDIINIVDEMERIDSQGKFRSTHVARPINSSEKNSAKNLAIQKIQPFNDRIDQCQKIYKEILTLIN